MANSSPVVLGGGAPIDRGRIFIDGRRMLGTNKTVKGFAYGLLLGCVAGLAEAILFGNHGLMSVGVLASIGALLGDLCGAFLKRRFDIAPGSPLPAVDQLDFILGAILFTYPLLNATVGSVLILVLATVPIHLLSNAVAYMLRLKSHRW